MTTMARTAVLETHPVDPESPIDSIEALRNHLYQAAFVELSTVPLYLYAAYSIQTQGYSQWSPGLSAFRTIRSVVIEEMLHLSLVRNLLIAIGGGDELTFYDRKFVPTYPSPMLHRTPELMLTLEPCTQDLMRRVFMPLELPKEHDAPAQPDEYKTLGQFYAAIADGFRKLDSDDLWAGNRPDLQYDRAYWNQDGGGQTQVVTDLTTALAAIDEIVEQGEGASPEGTVPLHPITPAAGLDELSHYLKFSRIAEGIDIIGAVHPVPVSPTAPYYGRAEDLAVLFDAAYSYLLCMLDALFNASTNDRTPGSSSVRYRLERTCISAMGGLLFPIADLLVQTPIGGGQTAAPRFGFHEFATDTPKLDQLASLCDGLLGEFPSLGGDDGVRRLIGLMPSV